jgi:hypothetical protein
MRKLKKQPGSTRALEPVKKETIDKSVADVPSVLSLTPPHDTDNSVLPVTHNAVKEFSYSICWEGCRTIRSRPTLRYFYGHPCTDMRQPTNLNTDTFLWILIDQLPITVAARSEAWTVFARSNTGVVGSSLTWGMDACVRLFCVCVILGVGSGLTTSWSPVQEVLPTVYRLRNWKKEPRSKGL